MFKDSKKFRSMCERGRSDNNISGTMMDNIVKGSRKKATNKQIMKIEKGADMISDISEGIGRNNRHDI